MEVKVLEVRDRATFIPVTCIRPVAVNEEQRYLLRCDGYVADETEACIIYIDTHRRKMTYDPYDWPHNPRTHRVAHLYIMEHWRELKDGDVVDVEHILGQSDRPKVSERITHPPMEETAK